MDKDADNGRCPQCGSLRVDVEETGMTDLVWTPQYKGYVIHRYHRYTCARCGHTELIRIVS